MAQGVNKCIFVGNVGRDPEVRQVGQQNKKLAIVSLALTDRKENTTWARLLFWEKKAEVAEQSIRKGSQLYVEARFQERSWKGRDGGEHTSSEFVVENFLFLGSPPAKRELDPKVQDEWAQFEAEADDEIPF